MEDFYKFAMSKGASSSLLQGYARTADAWMNPSIIEERKLNVASMDVFSRLMMDRIIFLGCEITDEIANIVIAQMLYLSSIDSREPISMYINSPGGIVSAGLGIYDTMQIIQPKVSITCVGIAASMAAVLLCAGEKGERHMLEHSRVMIHQPIGAADGQASDILIAAKEIEKTKAELCGIISKHTGKPLDIVVADCDRDHWMRAEEALDYGMVDDIITRSTKKQDK